MALEKLNIEELTQVSGGTTASEDEVRTAVKTMKDMGFTKVGVLRILRTVDGINVKAIADEIYGYTDPVEDAQLKEEGIWWE